jgi:hypothetical protein
LILTENDLQSIKDGHDNKKPLTKLIQSDKDSRYFRGHLFTRTSDNKWWFFYWDISKMKNRFDGGSHIHLICYLTHNRISSDEVIKKVKEWNYKIGGAFHICFK